MISTWIDIARNTICEFVLKRIVLFVISKRLRLKGYPVKSTHAICTNDYVMLRIDFADGITELPLSLKGWSEFRYDKGIHLCWWLKEDTEKKDPFKEAFDDPIRSALESLFRYVDELPKKDSLAYRVLMKRAEGKAEVV